MEKEFVPYQPSLDLKELGFNEPCFGYYYTLDGKYWEFAEKSEYYKLDDEINIGGKFNLPVSTFSQAFRWFREKYGLYSWVTMELGATLTFCWTITGENKGTEYKAFLKTHEEAELECLKKLIEIVKKKQE